MPMASLPSTACSEIDLSFDAAAFFAVSLKFEEID
jgi:hypothetical protein